MVLKPLMQEVIQILNTGIFVETNRSFNDIVRSIKYLLEEYDIDLDDFVYLI